MCNPQDQALKRALEMSDEEMRNSIAAPLENIPEERLIKLIDGYMKD